ncbi:MAG: glycosyl transferase family 2 [Bacteroidetes bacterium HGW-Bacteroidetes-20]|nr:MAG: glycosyl transferase family 2 [Bacteroidetes bacterium HGW-Bacteroidetes-20]
MFTFFQNYLIEITVSVFGFIILLQLLYYTLLFFKFAFHKPKPTLPVEGLPISVVISAKNEAHNLIKTLPIIADQKYPCFEIVVVNDNSNDETEFVIKDCATKYSNIKLVNLNSSVTNIKGKKFPLSLGIKAATYENILFTDADCFPVSDQWLSKMARHFTGKKQIVLGYSSFYKKSGLLNSVIRFDVLHVAIQYFSYYLAKMPFMGNGKNLAYTKDLFFKNKGFTSQYHLSYGDEELFINKSASYSICAIEYDHDSHTISRPKSHLNAWVRNKVNQNKARKLFQRKHRFLLNIYNTLMPLVYLLFIPALILTIHNYLFLSIVCGLMLLKIVFQFLAFGFAAKKLNEKRLIPFIILYDILFAIINPIIFAVTSLTKNR